MKNYLKSMIAKTNDCHFCLFVIFIFSMGRSFGDKKKVPYKQTDKGPSLSVLTIL